MCQAMAELKQQYWLEGRNEGKIEGRREGERLGLLRGRSEGKNQGILFSAKKMLENGISYEQIEKMLGVSRKDIEQYEKQQIMGINNR